MFQATITIDGDTGTGEGSTEALARELAISDLRAVGHDRRDILARGKIRITSAGARAQRREVAQMRRQY
jgi:hypothetical protein